MAKGLGSNYERRGIYHQQSPRRQNLMDVAQSPSDDFLYLEKGRQPPLGRYVRVAKEKKKPIHVAELRTGWDGHRVFLGLESGSQIGRTVSQ